MESGDERRVSDNDIKSDDKIRIALTFNAEVYTLLGKQMAR